MIHSKVGERGVQLSGGQKQRTAIARDPPILLLDEATSALDSDSEWLVQDILEKAMRGRTISLIAYTMSTVIGADMIVIVENGQVAQTGTHGELLITSKFYSRLFSMQDLSIAPQSRDSPTEDPNIVEEVPFQDTEKSEESVKDYQLRAPCTTDIPKNQRETISFFRIWFGLSKSELGKTAIGSTAAALSGISKPIFGFFIITVGVAYYYKDANQKVGWYSFLFCMLGLLSLLTHTLQHYYYGIVGEKVMTNLRKGLYSGMQILVLLENSHVQLLTYTLLCYFVVVLRNGLAWFEKPENSVGGPTS